MIDVHLSRLTWFDNVKNINKSLIRNLACAANGRNLRLILDHAQILDKIRHGNQLVIRKKGRQSLVKTIGHLTVKANLGKTIFFDDFSNFFQGLTTFNNVKTFY